jgi:transcription-repair coupling factor (superfamily II helicase)
VKRVDLGPKGGLVVFHSAASVDPVALVRLVQSEPKRYRFEGGERLRIHHGDAARGRHGIQALHAVFDRIAAKDAA